MIAKPEVVTQMKLRYKWVCDNDADCTSDNDEPINSEFSVPFSESLYDVTTLNV